MEHTRADGFILPDGEFIPSDDAQRMHAQAGKWLRSSREVLEFLAALAQECAAKGNFASAQEYFELLLEDNAAEAVRAYCLLSIGQLQERQENYAAAIDWYRRAFRLRPGADGTWYLLHNNLGYCLNRFGLHAEAEELVPEGDRHRPRPPQRPQEPGHRAGRPGLLCASGQGVPRGGKTLSGRPASPAAAPTPGRDPASGYSARIASQVRHCMITDE